MIAHELLAICPSRGGGPLTDSGSADSSTAERRRSSRRPFWMFGRAKRSSTTRGQTSKEKFAGVLGRGPLRTAAAEMLVLAARTREAIVCTFVTVDGLENVNSADAHYVGVADTESVADALAAVFRRSDILARWDGNNFVVLSVGPGPESDDVERRMTQRLQPTEEEYSGEHSVSVSAGRVVHMPWQDEDLDQIVDRADQEMRSRRRLRQIRNGQDDPEEP